MRSRPSAEHARSKNWDECVLREAGQTNEVLDLYAIGLAHVKALILQTTICEKRATTRRRGPSSTSWRHGDVDELRPEGGVPGGLEVVEQPRPAAETAAGCGCDAEHARPLTLVAIQRCQAWVISPLRVDDDVLDHGRRAA